MTAEAESTMSLDELLASAAPDRGTVVTVGTFDGLHRGHCHLLQHLRQLALPSYIAAVVTFSNHPRNVLVPGAQVRFITTPERKAQLIKEQGIPLVLSLEFTLELSQVRAQDFVSGLVENLKMKGLVAGPGFALGHRREGDLKFLRELGQGMGFWVEEVEPMLVDGAPIRSRRIREVIERGDVETAAQLLGHTFSLDGAVVRGDGLGRRMGFPTANIVADPRLVLPGDGVYATWAQIDGARRPSATSVGTRPTLGLKERLVEVYVVDFDENLYDRRMTVELVRKLRDQENFPSIGELVDQIHQDVANVRRILSGGEDAAP